VPLLLGESGELLDAMEYLAFQVYGRQLDKDKRFVCDADGFRQTRRTELMAMARFAADRTRNSGELFTFGPLNSTERRIIHMYLAEEEDLFSESVGSGRDRRLQVRLK
jgi:spoIIIJ-associated protein